MEKMKYGGHQILSLKNADGTTGTLIYDLDGHITFRVYDKTDPARFTDYDLRHSDLEVTIHDEAAFYELDDGTKILDHSAETLGLS